MALRSALVLAVLLPFSALSQNVGVIKQIAIQGTKRIENSTVRSYLLLQEGDIFDRRRIDQSLKSLYATGLFADVVIGQKGKTLIIKVVENPIINRIAFEGNRRIEDNDLRNEIILRPRVVFTRTKVQADVKRILEVYRVNGRFAASVVPKIIQLPQNRADLVFEINEGPLTRVQSIKFIGNKFESDSDLRGIIRSKETRWYRFYSSDDTYDPDRLNLDRELLRRHYLSKGYAAFRVNSAVGELTPDGKAFFITFNINEGARYKFGKIDVSADMRGIDRKKLIRLIGFKSGDRYDYREVDKAVDAFTDAVGSLGFAFVEVKPRASRDRKNKVINLTFQIQEGPRVYIERIDITGNVRTIDEVVRREIQLSEGDAYNASKIRRGRQKIQDLNYFGKVDLKTIRGSAADKTIIKVDVEEKSTGSLNLGAGYSTDVGPLVDFGLKEKNLLGKGQILSFNASFAGKRSTASVSFTEPYFLSRDVSAGFDVYHTKQNRQSESSYDSTKTGFGLRSSFPVAPHLRQGLRYKAESAKIENVSSSASNLIKTQKGSRFLSEIGHSLAYDRRDSRLRPKDGYLVKMMNDVAGLGGNVRYFRNQLKAAHYNELATNYIFSLGGQVGHILGISQDVKIPDRFVLGGKNLRGFANVGAGPRDIVTDDSLGGEWIYFGSTQLEFPLGLPNELGISGRLFSDFGSLGSVNPSNSNIKDTGNVRVSAGAGLGWISPFGPINVDLGWALKKESYDKTELFRFNFGTRF